MRKVMLSLVLGTSALTANLTAAADDPLDMAFWGATQIAVFGDVPYGTTPTDTSELVAFPAFVESINADRDVSLVLDVGDIHSGKQFCTLAYDQSIYDLFTAFRQPLVYTPGDNEWTDCHKTAEGGGQYNTVTHQIDYQVDPNTMNLIDYQGGNPAANLELIRSVFFSDPAFTLGKRRLVLSQHHLYSRAHPTDSNYVENVIFVKGRVLFVAVNIPGGSNNDNDVWYKAPAMSPEQTAEVSERTDADIRWLDTAFALAKLLRVSGVVIQTQADMWDLDGAAPPAAGQAAAHLAAFEGLIGEIAGETKAFRKPVLLFNGDSHIYRSDNPLVQNAPCVIEPASGKPAVACGADADAWLTHPFYDVPNFHRVVVHGSTFPLEWLKVKIDSRVHAAAGATAFGPFTWQREVQPAPAP